LTVIGWPWLLFAALAASPPQPEIAHLAPNPKIAAGHDPVDN
jgi:hypothetical protein